MKRFVVFLTCLLVVSYSQAQVIVLGDSSKINELVLNECGKADTFTTYIRVASGSLTGTTVLNDTFPSSYSFEGVIGSSVILGFSGIGSNIATLTLDPAVINAAGASGVRIRFLIRAKCGTNGLSSARHNLLLTWGGGSSLVRPGQDFVSANKAATLILEARNTVNQPNALLGNTYTRFWRIRNTGTNSTIDTIWFRVIHQPGLQHTGLIVNGATVTPTNQNGDTLWYRIVQSLRNQSVFPGDTVFVRETYRIVSCPPGSTSSRVSAYWGCYNTLLCNESFRTPSSSVPPTTPSMQYMGGWWFNSVDTRNVQGGRSSTCAGSPSTFQAFARNNSTAQASNVKIHLTSESNWAFPIQYDLSAWLAATTHGRANNAIDTSSIRYKIGNNGTWNKIPNTAFLATDNGITNNGPANCGLPVGWPNITFITVGIPGLINPNDSVFIEWKQYTKCCIECGAYHMNEASVRFDYSNACATANFFTDAQRLTWEFSGSSFSPLPPTYFATGASGYVKGQFSWGDNLDPDFDAPLGAYSDDSMRFEYTLPAGFVFDNNAGDVLMYNANLSASAAPARISYSGNLLRLTFARRNLPSAPGNAFELWTRLRLDCSIPGAVTGPVSIPVNAFRIENDCGCVMQPICSNVLAESGCPGPCPNGGASMTAFSNNRKNLGLPDENGDGWPNGTNLDPNFVKTRTFAWLDTMQVIAKGRIDTGAGNPNFQFLYFTQDFNQNLNINSPANHVWKFISATATLYDVSAGAVYSGNVTPTAVSGTNDQVMYNFSSLVPSGFNYEKNDSIVIQSLWRLSPNITISNQVPNATLFLNNSLYASRVANPSPAQRFSCGTINGAFETFQIAVFAHAGFSTSGCNWTFGFTNYFASGGYEQGDYFRYEVRRFHTIDTVFAIIPSYFKPDQSRNITFAISRDPGNPGPAANYNGTIPWSRLIRINDTLYKLPVGDLFTSGGGLAENSDDGANHQFYIPFNPSCNTPIGSFTPYHTVQYRDLRGSNWNWYPTIQNPNPSSAYIRRNQGNWSPSLQGVSSFTTAPNLQLVALNPNQQLVDDTALWDLRVDNLSNANPSFFTFMHFTNSSGRIIPVELRRLPGNTLVTAVNGIYQLGTVNQGTSITYRVKAAAINCNLDSLVVRLGQDCGGYPSNISAYTCAPRIAVLRANPLDPLVQTDLISAPPAIVNLCDTMQWTISVSSRQLASAFNLSLDVLIPDGGAGGNLVGPSTFKYPFNTPSWTRITPVHLGGGLWRFFLSDSIPAIRNNGLRPIGEAPLNELLLRVRMVTNCNFTSGSNIRFITNSRKACGSLITPDAEFNPIVIFGAPTPKVQLIGQIAPSIATCDQDFTVNVTTRNLETSSTSSADKIWITLPAGAYLTPGSIVFTHNPLSPALPVLDTIGGRQRLKWTATTINAGDSTVFRFRYRSPSNIPCGTNDEFKFQTVTQFSTVCGATSCNSFVENANRELSRPVMKPNVKYLLGTGLMQIVQDTTLGNVNFRDTLILSGLNFNNSGNDTAALTNMRIYRDVNNNNIFDAGDVSYALDSMMNILPAQTRTYTRIFSFPHRFLPSALKIELNTACNCDASRFAASPAFGYVPLSANAINFNVQKVNTNARLTWSTPNNENVLYFRIERKTQGQTEFQMLATVYPISDMGFKSYNYTDIDAGKSEEIVFYRIAIVNKIGTEEKTKTKFVDFSGKERQNQISIWPNPAKEMVNITVLTEGQKQYKIYTINGKALLSGTYTDLGNIQVSTKELQTGLYIISVKGDFGTYTEKIIVEK